MATVFESLDRFLNQSGTIITNASTICFLASKHKSDSIALAQNIINTIIVIPGIAVVPITAKLILL